jgi:hypothetical protein
VNEQDEPRSDAPEFDDPAFDDVRALLAQARVTEPVPDEVAARLDATLSSLQTRRAAEAAADAESAPAVVVPLRRRVRQRAGRVLVAAAVVAVVGAGGVGIAQLSGNPLNSSADKATSADRAQDGAGGSTASGVAPEVAGATGTVPRTTRGSRAVPELTTAAFAADAARVMVALAADQVADAAGKAASQSPSDATGNLDSRSPAPDYNALDAPAVTASPQASADQLAGTATCAGPDAPDAVVVPATLDGGAVALVFRPPTGSGQRVEAWSCDGATLLEGATVPIQPPR